MIKFYASLFAFFLEAFDKVARAIGLGYPGGPKIDKISKEGNPHAYEFPRTKITNSIYDFSWLSTAEDRKSVV